MCADLQQKGKKEKKVYGGGNGWGDVGCNFFWKCDLPEPPTALYLALLLAIGYCRLIIQSELISFFADSSRYLACQNISQASAILSDRVFDNSHCMIVTQVNEHRFASDLKWGEISVISPKKLSNTHWPQLTIPFYSILLKPQFASLTALTYLL